MSKEDSWSDNERSSAAFSFEIKVPFAVRRMEKNGSPYESPNIAVIIVKSF